MPDKFADPEATATPNPRWVRLMADYSSTGLWNSLGECMGTDELPVSVAWLEQLEKWCIWYEQNDDYLPTADRKQPPFPLEAFCEQGLALAKALKSELGTDWTVVYFDELAASQAAAGGPRDVFEYEVLAQS